jgi:CBS domain-containing protein/PII-like signaling protein
MMVATMRQATRVRIYCDQGDHAGHTPLATAVVQLLWREHASGVTVLNAVEGFGASRVLHSARLVDVGANAPVVVEWLDSPERFDVIWPQLEPLVRHAVVTMETVDMLVGLHHALRRLEPEATVAEVMRTDLVTVVPAAPLREVVALMRAQDLRFVPVLAGDEIAGVITNGDLVSRGGLSMRLDLLDAAGGAAAIAVADKAAGEVMTPDPVTTTPSTLLTDAARLMLDLGLKRLPVVESGRLVGLVSRLDLLRTVADVVPENGTATEAHGGRTAGEVAVAAVPVVHPDTPVADVLDAVVSTRLNRAVVVDDQRRVLGVVSDAEVLRRFGGEERGILDRLMGRGGNGHLLRGRTAADLMVGPVTTVPRDLPLRDAIARMLHDNVKLLPVVDEDGRLHGMIDRADALRAAFEPPGKT